ncbi:hypothetical protein HNR46_003976 [Haloferula luteola]|uniref:Uncharacterized protein n=1 Tax=Haloferula luteola TaxID=595692 RepID=A0A840V6R6_9BACT|nr:hypothetical protein [Haloferula luteola]MBB5353715.1 hypothetical protein [Haloferula luteola]
MSRIRPVKLIFSVLVGCGIGLLGFCVLNVGSMGFNPNFDQGDSREGQMFQRNPSAAEFFANDFNREMDNSGMFSNGSNLQLVNPDGSFVDSAWKKLGISDHQIREAQRAFILASSKVDKIMKDGLKEDSRAHINYGEEWDCFYIQGNAEQSEKVIEGLKRELAVIRNDKAEEIFNGLHVEGLRGYFGKSDIYIQRRKVEKGRPLEMVAQYFDPVTGFQIREITIEDRASAEKLFGEQAASDLAP